jgi:phage-related protein
VVTLIFLSFKRGPLCRAARFPLAFFGLKTRLRQINAGKRPNEGIVSADKELACRGFYANIGIMAEGKPVIWIRDSRRSLQAFPEDVQDEVGFALYQAQLGHKHPSAKPLKGYKGAGVLEIVEDFDGDTYRAVYTVKLADAIYVLHAFQKKSKSGIKTPQHQLDLIEQRLKEAKEISDGRKKTPKS